MVALRGAATVGHKIPVCAVLMAASFLNDLTFQVPLQMPPERWLGGLANRPVAGHSEPAAAERYLPIALPRFGLRLCDAQVQRLQQGEPELAVTTRRLMQLSN